MTPRTPRTLHPAYPVARSGHLDVGDGQRIAWSVAGAPDGIPVVFVHGGPGGGSSPDHRRLFDPATYRVVQFDQRGCGGSTPHVADGADLSVNTTDRLVADMERLREHLGVERWTVSGGSWGTTLALAYATTHPGRVEALLLRGIFLCRAREIDWYYRGGAAHLFPEAWQGYLAPLVAADGAEAVAAAGYDHVAAYHRLLHCGDPAVERAAAHAWTDWEMETSTLLPRPLPPESEEDRFALAFARIENHYFVHDAFLADHPLLDRAPALAGIPTVIVHGRYDVVCPVENAWLLHHALPGSELHVVPDAGHAMAEPGTTDRLVDAAERLARQRVV